NRTLERDRQEDAAIAARGLQLVASSGERDDPEARTMVADLSASVHQAVAALPLGQRAAVQLFYLCGLSYKETATQLGIGEGTVRTRLYKARGALRGSLRLLGQEEQLTMMGNEMMGEKAMSKEQGRTFSCSFCGKGAQQVRRMIAGPGGVYI